MTTKALDAVFENGVFRPVAPPMGIGEGQRVRLFVEPSNGSVLEMAAHVYEGLTEDQVDDIEQIALDRKPFFGTPDR